MATINYNSVHIHPEAQVALLDAAAEAVAVLPCDVALPADPAPKVQTRADGALRVWIDHPTRRHRVLAAVVVPAGYWHWLQ